MQKIFTRPQLGIMVELFQNYIQAHEKHFCHTENWYTHNGFDLMNSSNNYLKSRIFLPKNFRNLAIVNKNGDFWIINV